LCVIEKKTANWRTDWQMLRKYCFFTDSQNKNLEKN
jgi:hypothetical protein